MTNETIILAEESFDKNFPLVKNHLDSNAAFDGCLFETFGAELDHVRQTPSEYVWTYQENDNGRLCITSGFHVVSRIGYLISTVPWNENTYVQIDSLVMRNQSIKPGIYIFNADEYESVEDSLDDGTGLKLEILYPITSKENLLKVLCSAESIINAIGEDRGWIAVFADATYELQAVEINCLPESELVKLMDSVFKNLGMISKADHVLDVTVIDPETKGEVEVSLYKDRESKGIFGVEGAYLVTLSDDKPVSNPFTGQDILLID